MTRARLLSALGVSTMILAACGGATPPPQGAETKAPAPAPAASGQAGGGAPKASSSSSSSDKLPFDGEDPGKTVKLTGPKAWVLTSNGIGLYDFVKTEGTKAVFKDFGGEGDLKAPQAFTFQSPASQKVKKGTIVLVTVVTSAECGRVVDVGAEKVKVAFEWSGKVDTREAPPAELLALDGALGYGAPILFKEHDDDELWQDGQLVYQDGKTAWLTNGSKVPVKSVRPIDVLKTRKPGDKVLARTGGMMSVAAATVKKVVDDGLRFEVDFDGHPGTVSICNIATLPK